VVQAHAGQEPSAAEMIEIVRTAKEKKVAAIFTEPQYPARIGKTIARESGILTATLNPVATGPENALLDYFETVMRQNMVILKETLGTR
jgi:ABC-type Zn uptake system ZnuABC Zn-binding protein ZnuA